MAEATERDSIKLVEEVAAVAAQKVTTGRIRVSTAVDLVEERLRHDLTTETVQVTRVPKNEVLSAPPMTRTEGDLTIIPVVEEVLFIEKRLVLKEEIHLRRTVKTETAETPVVLRKQRAIVEHVQVPTPSPERIEK